MYASDCKHAMKQHKAVRPLSSKDQIAKARSRVGPCYTMYTNFDSFSLAKQLKMLLWKWFTILLRNLSCQSSYFQWKLTIGWFLGWNENFQGLEQPHFLVLQLCRLILYSLLHPTFASLQATPGLEIWQVCAAPGLGRLSTLGWWGQCKYHTWRETYL